MHRWLQLLGFKHEQQKKYYFVDGHETPETKQYRKVYVKEILEMEKRMHRWIQLSVSDALEITKKHTFMYESGYFYTDKQTGEKMVEYHVDACNYFHTLMENSRFGGNLSVCFPENEKRLYCLDTTNAYSNSISLPTKGG